MTDLPAGCDEHLSDTPPDNLSPTASIPESNSIDYPSTASVGFDLLIQQSAQVISGMELLRSDFETKIKYDQSKERVIEVLHNELQDLREDLAFKILSPLVKDLVGIYDDISTEIAEDVGQQESQSQLSSARYMLEQITAILERYGFELFETNDSVFDRRLHSASRAVLTNEKELHLVIVERIRPGLRYGDRIIRPEKVVVYQHKPE